MLVALLEKVTIPTCNGGVVSARKGILSTSMASIEGIINHVNKHIDEYHEAFIHLSVVRAYAEGINERVDKLGGELPVAAIHTPRTVQEEHYISTTLANTALNTTQYSNNTAQPETLHNIEK